MRLLSLTPDHEIELKEFEAGSIPPYTILSHTWKEGNELMPWDIRNLADPSVRDKSGFKKMMACVETTLALGLRHTWIDSCCIDKTSSAELSEAINSMFTWYADAEMCLVHLADFHGDSIAELAGAGARWFSRGWTLQELIAPRQVVFYTGDWRRLGDISQPDVLESITRITRISSFVLGGRRGVKGRAVREEKMLDDVSVHRRMSWAAHRVTTRPEDIAYCLFGLFDVNLPPLYGEGRHKAFLRLQFEIMRLSDDRSIFNWQSASLSPNNSSVLLRGLLASGPEEFTPPGTADRDPSFQRSNNYSPHPFAMTNQGIGFKAYLYPFNKIDIDTHDGLRAVRAVEGSFYSQYLFAMAIENRTGFLNGQNKPYGYAINFILVRRTSKDRPDFVRAYPQQTWYVHGKRFQPGEGVNILESITLQHDTNLRGDALCLPPSGFLVSRASYKPSTRTKTQAAWSVARGCTIDAKSRLEHPDVADGHPGTGVLIYKQEEGQYPCRQLTGGGFVMYCLFQIEIDGGADELEPGGDQRSAAFRETLTDSENPNHHKVSHWFVIGFNPQETGWGRLYIWKLDKGLWTYLVTACNNATELEDKLPRRHVHRQSTGMHVPTIPLSDSPADGDIGLEMSWRWRTRLYRGASVIDIWMSLATEKRDVPATGK